MYTLIKKIMTIQSLMYLKLKVNYFYKNESMNQKKNIFK